MSTINDRIAAQNPIKHQVSSAPPPFLVPLLKLPLILYKARLGWLLGHRFALLTHRGRRSGKTYRTVLAVLRFDPRTREIAAISAWSGSQWFKNIVAAPPLSVETGRVHYVPLHRFLTASEIASLFEEYREKRPVFSRMVCRIPGWKWDASHEELLDLANELRGVVLSPASAP